MRELPAADEIPLTEACLIAREGSDQLRRKVLRGVVRGRQIGSRWYVKREDALRLAPAPSIAQSA
jgi:hypothetical protein